MTVVSNLIFSHYSAHVQIYAIAGGGTAGLTLANRLTENPNVTVAVLEAVALFFVACTLGRQLTFVGWVRQGKNHIEDLPILAPGSVVTLWGNDTYDWVRTTSICRLFELLTNI